MRELRRNPLAYAFQRQAAPLVATAADDAGAFYAMRAAVAARIRADVNAGAVAACVAGVIEDAAADELCAGTLAYACTPWGRLAREVMEEVGHLDSLDSGVIDAAGVLEAAAPAPLLVPVQVTAAQEAPSLLEESSRLGSGGGSSGSESTMRLSE